MMTKVIKAALLFTLLLMACKKKDAVTPPPANTSTPNAQHASVLTQHNNNTRAGLNNQETALNTGNVNTTKFGRLFNLNVDDDVYTQPLVYGNLSIGGSLHNVVFIATVNNTVYAFDADNGKLYWKTNYTQAGMNPPNITQMNSAWCNPYYGFGFHIGITGTPVIDSTAKTIYFVAKSFSGKNFYQYLHAVDLTNGSEKPGSPVLITGSVPGKGDGSVNNTVSFDPLRANQRQALTLVNGTVYVTYASHCDWNPYHGWIFGYNAQSLQLKTIYNNTPDGEAGGLWESGQGPAADDQGNLYEVSGNGTVGNDAYTASINGTDPGTSNTNPADLKNRGESATKLSPAGTGMQVSSFFTPSSYFDMDLNDLDYGVMGAMLIPNSNYFLTGAKDGNLYLLNKDNMGGYSSTLNAVQQTIPLNVALHCQPAYYKGPTGEFVYVWAENDRLRAMPFNAATGTFSNNHMVATIAGPTGEMGAFLSVSSNGQTTGTGVVWAYYTAPEDNYQGHLAAFDAADVSKELWDSSRNPADIPGTFAKFSTLTIVNGHLYVPTLSKMVVVYGLK
ncbi:PQQ-binding-like beta-propeller repeat protein [Mucilaginibacter gotjawali]|uniref:Outer membrane protein assembly factor BamB n=1 Tax=Mucilaginibacter gotjawali TaxID=1550579 RepID=A0A839SFT6_9SPHI|nr:PQQ-binding-like beta-propeller repeat protein [Mucilaginibacter gotjawali]MBB3057131.1 hypothetical protein [Mucilaginibacter gotjawali]